MHAVLLINSAKLDTSLFLSLLNDTFEGFLEGKIFNLSQFVSRFVAERTVRFSTVTWFPSIPCFYREFMVFDHLFSSEPRIWMTLPSPPKKGHFRVARSLCFKARLSVKPIIFRSHADKTTYHKNGFPLLWLSRFEIEGFWNSVMTYSWSSSAVLGYCCMLYVQASIKVQKEKEKEKETVTYPKFFWSPFMGEE